MTTKTKAVATTDRTAAAGPRPGLMRRMSMKFGIEQEKMLETLKATAFRQRGKEGKPPPDITNEQMTALLLVAERYDLDPFVKQLYAFPNQAGGIEPIVPIDGWIKLINEHPQFQDMELLYPETEGGEIFPWIECIIERKDRKKPTKVREYLHECLRDTIPWKSHPARMLRHKAIIQCGRVAFGLSGISDPDEGDRILESSVVSTVAPGKPETRKPRAIGQDSGTAELPLGAPDETEAGARG